MGGKDRRDAKAEREETKARESEAKAKKAEEDAYWAAAGEGQKSKAGKKKDEEESRKLEAAAKKAEAKRLAEAEEAELASSSKGKAKAATPKVTAAQLAAARESERKAQEDALAAKKLAARKEVDEASYDALVDVRNTNREEEAVEGRGLDEAVRALETLTTAGSDPASADAHPERRRKAAWQAFQDSELPKLKEEKPGLKRQQYIDMLWTRWQKSPDNPVNAAARAAAG